MEYEQFKIEVFIPEEYLEELITELQNVGAGKNGLHDSCMSISDVTSLYRRMPGSTDLLGVEVGKVVRRQEKKLEVKIQAAILGKVLGAIMKVHPYENPMVNVIPLL